MARPVGSKNKRTFHVEQLAARFKTDPFEILMMIALNDWKGMGYESRYRNTTNADGELMQIENIPIAERAKCAKEAAKYLHSQKQSIEHSTAQEGFKITVEDYT